MTRRSRLKKRLKKLIPAVTLTLTTVPFAVWSPSASAFFPPLWPVSPPVASVPPVLPPPVIVVPPLSPPPFVPPVVPPVVVPPVVPPPIVVPPVSPPTSTPEPATVVSSLIGLAAAAGYGVRRRQQKSDEGKAG
jgi:hypothetical protein